MIIYISKKIHDFSEKDIFIEFFKYVSCFLAKVFIRTHLIAGNSSPSWLVVYRLCLAVWCGIQQCSCSCFIYLIISEWGIPHLHTSPLIAFLLFDLANLLTMCNLLYCYTFAGVVLLDVFAAVQTSDCLPEIAEISFRRLSSQRQNCVKSKTST